MACRTHLGLGLIHHLHGAGNRVKLLVVGRLLLLLLLLLGLPKVPRVVGCGGRRARPASGGGAQRWANQRPCPRLSCC